ncbi:hypothetical protein C943_01135 [Mariniradius saccharolyticus AK6]|uniref:Polysaccharide chain length determinant N-terminal domain-containing protein n=1 Tax=Mariniradius saccharolyticus AK6 TaxID=1239962 RepID=M7XCW9_9BACT|nr:Wzz/FepE/Etk N-terminal domain-containing protein [Mariniradius saccharolyticus]EMS32408.1 hypothetical protein C943_01135 [Mariniradius saccharolyticus AK6]
MQKSQNTEVDEIDLVEIFRVSWANRRKIFLTTILFVIFGLLVAFLIPKEYAAGSTFVPQVADGSKVGGSLSGLASLAGINLGGLTSGNEIPPTLYPKIVSSVPFKKQILEAKVTPAGLPEMTYAEFFNENYNAGVLSTLLKYTLGLPGLILKTIRPASQTQQDESNPELISFSEEELEHFKRLDNQMSVQFNDKEGFVSLSFRMPEPLLAAQMAKFAEDLLQREVIGYKIQNAREHLKYTEERFEEKRKEFEEIQTRLANFRDRNQNISSAFAQNRLTKLEAEYNFVLNVYTELAKQLETAKLQVSRDTPVFSVIQPVSVPIEKDSPKRVLILAVFLIFGIVTGLGLVFGKIYWNGLREELFNTDKKYTINE